MRTRSPIDSIANNNQSKISKKDITLRKLLIRIDQFIGEKVTLVYLTPS